jgi:hypothetical protein
MEFYYVTVRESKKITEITKRILADAKKYSFNYGSICTELKTGIVWTFSTKPYALDVDHIDPTNHYANNLQFLILVQEFRKKALY